MGFPGEPPGATAGSTSGLLLLLRSGTFLRFGQMITDGSDPALDNRAYNKWFDTSKFQRALPFTQRTNPLQYPGVVGPHLWSLDTTLSKFFPIKERFQLEFKFEAYNTTNTFVGGLPNTSVTAATFGRIMTQDQENRGREMQYSLRLHF